MPELAPVTRAFWPLSTLRTGHAGITTSGSGSSSAIMEVHRVKEEKLSFPFDARRQPGLRRRVAGPSFQCRQAAGESPDLARGHDPQPECKHPEYAQRQCGGRHGEISLSEWVNVMTPR